MDFELLENMYIAAPELWFGIAFLVALLVILIFVLAVLSLKLKQKNYFLRRDRERYAETLYASHDGYFAFIYPDDKVNDPRKEITERYSRRLAVILGLDKGIKSEFNDILKKFYRDDAKKIIKYVALLKEEGVAFEDYFLLKTAEKYIRLEGVRINGADGNIYCDMIWFRDVSFATNRINTLEKEKKHLEKNFLLQQDLLDNLPFPVWLRDDFCKIIYCNKKFAELIPNKNRDEIIDKHIEITGTTGESVSLKLAEKTHRNKRADKITTGVVVNGNRITVEAFENPFYAEQNLEKTYSAGCLVDINELDELRRNLKQYQEAQLEILGSLGTAFAVFNQNMNLDFYNQSFATLWNLKNDYLNNNFSYLTFLDIIRENRLLPEVPDYKSFKNDEAKKFSQIIEPTSDLLHLPNGKTVRRMRSPYPMGGIVFAYEDISDRLAATSAYNELMSRQNDILENIFDAVLIFGVNGRLIFFNNAYVDLWNADKNFLKTEPSFNDVLDSQKSFFRQNDDWTILKKGISDNILSMVSKIITLKRNNGDILQLSIANLSDGSLMVCYRKSIDELN